MASRLTTLRKYAAMVQATRPPQSWPTTTAFASPSARTNPAASDAAVIKPPRGYDLITEASGAAGLVRALGEANAVVVGHDWGGLVTWTMGAYYPKVVRRLAVVSAPHPLRIHSAVVTDPFGQGR